MDIVDMVLAGLVNTALVRRAAAHGIAAIGLSGADAQLLLGERLHATSRTARPVASTTVALDAAWAAGLVPIVAPVGSDATHTAVNINADDAAQTLAEAVGPGTVLCYISDIPGVLDKNGDTLPTITVPEIEALIAAGVAHGGMAAKLRSAARALRAGVGAVTIGDISGDSDLESLLNRKRGTTIISA
jgi:acetylglutamate kinase